jgi:stage III sporulation protein SpoIIIAA
MAVVHALVTEHLQHLRLGFVAERLVQELSTGRFISPAENVLIFGPPGVGKPHQLRSLDSEQPYQRLAAQP